MKHRQAVNRFILEERLERNYKIQNVIISLLHLSLEDIPLEELLKRAINLVVSISWIAFESRGSIFLAEDGEPTFLVMKAQNGLAPSIQEACKRVLFGECLCGQAALSGEVQFACCLDNQHSRICKSISQHGHYSVPIRWRKQALGVINIYLKEGHHRAPEEEQFLVAVADTLARAIICKRKEEEISFCRSRLRSSVSRMLLKGEREKHHIAVGLHDRVGHALALAKIKLGAIQESVSTPDLNESLNEVRKLIEQSIQDIRSFTFELSPPILYEIGFVSAVKWLVEQFQEKHKIISIFEDDGQDKPLDNNTCIIMFRGVGELLFNVVKYAKAQKVKVSIQRDGDNVQITVEDDGVGFDASKIGPYLSKTGGFGLFSIREQLIQLGGSFRIESAPGKGAKITLGVPIKNIKETSGGT